METQTQHDIDIVTENYIIHEAGRATPNLPEFRPATPEHERATPNLPSATYISDKRNYRAICLPLYEAALKGDWEAAQLIINQFPRTNVINVSITNNYETVLHIAASTKHIHFVAELVSMIMNPKDLELEDKNGNTALCFAATAGTVEIAKIMIQKNPNLPKKRGSNNMLPLLMAALCGHKQMVSYLYSKSENMTAEDFTHTDRVGVFNACITANLYDVPLELLEHHKQELALEAENNALHILARNPSVLDGTQNSVFSRLRDTLHARSRIGPDDTGKALKIIQIIWGEVVELEDKDISNIIRGPIDKVIKVRKNNDPAVPPAEYIDYYPSRLLFVAVALGNTKFLVELIRLCPELIWKVNDDKQTIFHVAVLHRQEGVYNLLYEIGSIKTLVTSYKDINNNNILHLAAKKPEQSRLATVSGVAFQMQREILWFKEVQSMVNPSFKEEKNNQGKTPQDLFTDEHKELMEKGERWMKETASQCMVVATLIATIMFAAAITFPGGNDEGNGHPVFEDKSAFMVFVITDALSLFSSSASILMFLSILTSRYAEGDFFASLPKKLMIGLLALFISITTMMIAFSASFFLLHTKDMKWVPYSVTGLAAVPVVLFATLQSGLLIDVFRTTISSRSLFKPKKHMLY